MSLEADSLKCEEWWDASRRKVEAMMAAIGDRCPHVSATGEYDDTRLDWWTSGFWPGMLWIMHDRTGDSAFREAAWNWDERMEKLFLETNRFHHDVGFQFLPTAVLKYKLTGDVEGRRRGLAAANYLAGRFNLNGRFLRAWNQVERPGWAIIDTMMNLSLLYWASGVSEDPRFRQIATAHADTALRHFVRDDNSVRHIVVFDAETGEYKETLGGQGFSPTSSWSRGQAWAIYGFTNCYRYTGELRFLRAAQHVAHYFISCLPDDDVAYWDFRVTDPADTQRDTSAASCAASGMLDLADQLPEEEGRLYRTKAMAIVRSLSERYSTFDQPGYQGILKAGTGNKAGNANVDVALIYGDYFYVEALAKLQGWSTRVF